VEYHFDDCILHPTVATSHFEAGLQHQATKTKIELALAKSSVGKYSDSKNVTNVWHF
jgi:hypothetical protein